MKNETSRVIASLEMFVRRSWPLLVAGGVLVLGVLGIIVLNILKNPHEQPVSVVQAETSTTAMTSSSTGQVLSRVLDGVPVPYAEAALQPFAVMVENAPEARPLMGPAKANVVIEAPVEGGITRFMLVFDATTTVDQIGPVRSARPYYVDWADALSSVYAHVGGSPEALQRLSTLDGFRNLDQFFYAPYFWRTNKREAPHNVYTRTDLLREAATKKQWSASLFRPWKYLSSDVVTSQVVTTASSTDAQTISVPYGGSFNVTWSYDAEARVYQRRQAGSVQKDADGQAVQVKNVVVMLVDATVVDDVGRLRLRTTGSGKAVIFRNGQRQDATWHRGAREWISFEQVDGGDVLFEPGSTWISVVTSPTMMPK